MNRLDRPTSEVGGAIRKLLNGREELFPAHLCANYPQIVEKICKHWREQNVLQKYFFELLITDREKRAGFSPEIYREIIRLSNYYSTLSTIGVRKDNFWQSVEKKHK